MWTKYTKELFQCFFLYVTVSCSLKHCHRGTNSLITSFESKESNLWIKNLRQLSLRFARLLCTECLYLFFWWEMTTEPLLYTVTKILVDRLIINYLLAHTLKGYPGDSVLCRFRFAVDSTEVRIFLFVHKRETVTSLKWDQAWGTGEILNVYPKMSKFFSTLKHSARR